MTLYITPAGRLRQRRMERLGPELGFSGRSESDVFVPVDVKAEADSFVITALVPGVEPEDISIQVMNETVTIQGEIKDDRGENDTYLLAERPTGRFSRFLTLPVTLDSAQAEANLDSGVLTLRIPKAETARPKVIKVK